MPIDAYGGTLVDRVIPAPRQDAVRRHAATLRQIPVSQATLSDLYLVAVGALSPLTGFMDRATYESVLDKCALPNGLPWSVPVTLPVTSAAIAGISAGDSIALLAPDGEIAARMLVEEIFPWEREREAAAVYGTRDRVHPGVARLHEMGDLLLGGSIEYLYSRDVSGFPEFNLTPAQTRAAFAERGWRTVVAFQTRNPVHRAHEYLQKCALETVDGLLLHPLVGVTKEDDVPAAVRMECYKTVLQHYFPADRVLLSVLPAAMRYAGPREAIFHAILRRNYGCTHFIVGRDHAGVGSFYGTYEAQEFFDTIDLEKLGIQPLKFEHAFYCNACGQMASKRTCPHGPADHVFLSGTRVRGMLQQGERPPAEFSRPEVADVLVRAYAPAEYVVTA